MAVHPNPEAVAPAGEPSPKRPAAGCLRPATEFEEDTLRKQLEAVIRHARACAMPFMGLRCDEWGGGLRTDRRSALRQMFRDIESGGGDFGTLVDPGRRRSSTGIRTGEQPSRTAFNAAPGEIGTGVSTRGIRGPAAGLRAAARTPCSRRHSGSCSADTCTG